MIPTLIALGLAALALAGVCLLAEAGIRNGDRPGDVLVRVELRTSGQPGERRPLLIARIDNPADAPVIAGLSARRSRIPAWLAPGGVTVPVRTARRGLRASEYDTVGIVPASGTARFTVPVAEAARRYRLTAAAGQRHGRLRLHRIVIDAPLLPEARAKHLAGR